MSLLTEDYEVGTELTLLKDIDEPPCGDSPGGRLATKGDRLIIRRIYSRSTWPISVSHLDVTDSTFDVALNEVETVK
jgi:hypothetical protein